MKSGVVIIDKTDGISSQGAVNRLKRLLGADKAGHTGTLDPMATGVLPILVGRAVKASEFLLHGNKHYSATLLLGITTDTEDVTGITLSETDRIPGEEEVISAVKSMRGKSMQTPPMYSAIKIGGKKLYNLARDGITVDREAREITVFEISSRRISEREYIIDVECSKGTYIRTLCADIGKKLGCGGVMKTLRRTYAAGFSLSEAHTIEEIEKMDEKEREALIIPTEEIFKDKRAVILPDFFARLARCGVEIYLKKINLAAELGEQLRLYDKNGFFALAEVREFEGGAAAKPIRQFEI